MSLTGSFEVGDEEPLEVVPMIDRFLWQVPEPRSCGLFEVQLDELHGGVTGAVMELYRCQVIIDPGLWILSSVVF